MTFRPLALALLAAFITCQPVLPQTGGAQGGTTYTVEVIVFRAKSAMGGAENWSAQASSGDEDASVAAASRAGRVIATLTAAQLQLNDAKQKLRLNGNYVPVAHAAWTQTASAWGSRAGINIQSLRLKAPGLTGSISLERGQYLHLGVTLRYAMDTPPAGLGAAPGTVFTLNESRRVRLNERHYFDHPAFGVIAIVTPVSR